MTQEMRSDAEELEPKPLISTDDPKLAEQINKAINIVIERTINALGTSGENDQTEQALRQKEVGTDSSK